MTNWSKKNTSCLKCGTIRYPHKAKELCTRCYPLSQKIQAIEAWDLNVPNTLRYCPREYILRNRAILLRIQSGMLKQLHNRLQEIYTREYPILSGADGSTIEYILERIAALCSSTPHQMFHQASLVFDHRFTPDQRSTLYCYLLEILESSKWRGINLYEVFDPQARKS